MKIIFIVDDSDTSLSIAKKALENQYRVLTMSSGERLFKFLEKITPDLIILDIQMPEMDGFEVIKILKFRPLYADIPVIFLTSSSDDDIEAKGFELGAVDFILKPFSALVLLNRIKIQLDIENVIGERIENVKLLQDKFMSVIANVIEERDIYTVGHNDRIATYIKILLAAMKERAIYAEISSWDIDKAASAARLHDMGKINVLETILNKPGKLDDNEFNQIKTHPIYGANLIGKISKQAGEKDFLHNAKLFAEYHHERWDGTGYPHGLKETDIPLHGRIMAVVDAYDALVSKRPYKEPLSNEEAVKIISSNSGKQFDPKIIEIFIAVQEQLKETRGVL
ncbi:HD-GYP domain-containing protein [Treponema sp. R80B11-R83G3]